MTDFFFPFPQRSRTTLYAAHAPFVSPFVSSACPSQKCACVCWKGGAVPRSASSLCAEKGSPHPFFQPRRAPSLAVFSGDRERRAPRAPKSAWRANRGLCGFCPRRGVPIARATEARTDPRRATRRGPAPERASLRAPRSGDAARRISSRRVGIDVVGVEDDALRRIPALDRADALLA